MAATYEPIATTTLGSAAASYTFSSIPGTYTDLVLISNGASDTTATNFIVQFNGDTASNYSQTRLLGNGTAASSTTLTSFANFYIGRAAASGGTTANVTHIMNYANTTTYKTTISKENDSAQITGAIVGLWRSTAAITSIKIFLGNAANINTGTTFTLYGIKAA